MAAAKPAEQVRVGEVIKFDAPRIPTPGSHFEGWATGGYVGNPSRVPIESPVVEVERLPSGRLRFHTDANVTTDRDPDDKVLVA
jgi:hypothetical protein